MTLIEDFRKEIREILSGTIKERRIPEWPEYWKFIERESRIVSYPIEIIRPYGRAFHILRKKSDNAQKFKRNFLLNEKIYSLLDDFIIKLKYEDEEMVMTDIDGRIGQLFESIQKMQTERYLFFIPIMALSVEQDLTLTIGDSNIIALSEPYLQSIESQYSTKLRIVDETLSETIERLRKTDDTSTFAEVTVEAPDDVKAVEIAVQKADTCLNVLRLYNSGAQFYLRDEFPQQLTSSIMYLNINTKCPGQSYRVVNSIPTIPEINSRNLNMMRRLGLNIIDTLLLTSEKDLTELQKSILDAIFWFGNGVKDRQQISKFVKYLIAMEAILIPTNERNKKETIAKRFTSIMYSKGDNEKKKEVYRTMSDLYILRNYIIHRGENSVSETDLNITAYWAQQMVLFVLPYAEKYNTVTELINKEFPIDESFFSREGAVADKADQG